jgi:hypothetical protein
MAVIGIGIPDANMPIHLKLMFLFMKRNSKEIFSDMRKLRGNLRKKAGRFR